MNNAESSLKGGKHCGKRRNCSLRAISPFPTVFSKDLYCTGLVWERVHSQSLFHLSFENVVEKEEITHLILLQNPSHRTRLFIVVFLLPPLSINNTSFIANLVRLVKPYTHTPLPF